MKELQALENAVKSTNVQGLRVSQYHFEDKRKKTGMYFLSLNGTCISPKLDYDNMNHFILGFLKAIKLNLTNA